MISPVPTDRTNVDLAPFRDHFKRYREMWTEAKADDRKETMTYRRCSSSLRVCSLLSSRSRTMWRGCAHDC